MTDLREIARVIVNGSFTARHICAEPVEHEHIWNVEATFEVAPRTDARCYIAMLDGVLSHWEGTLLPPQLEWSEDIAAAVGQLVNCVRVVVSRPADRIATEWLA